STRISHDRHRSASNRAEFEPSRVADRTINRYDRAMDPNAPGSAISYWLSASPAGPARRPLRGDGFTDVAIVGAGFTGLWTAIALTDTDPALRVTLLEAERVGFGASGRNGAVCCPSVPPRPRARVLHRPT